MGGGPHGVRRLGGGGDRAAQVRRTPWCGTLKLPLPEKNMVRYDTSSIEDRESHMCGVLLRH
jgi:hypothetical protein